MPHAYGTYSDDALVALLSRSDEAAFTELYHRYWQRLFTVAANKLSSLPDAEELVQDLFADLWRRRAELELTGPVNRYLAAALKYKVINCRVKRAREAARTVDTVSQEPGYLHVAEMTDQRELEKRLEALVTQLPEKHQLVFRLSRQGQLSHKEIAQELDVSEKTVEYHLTRALRSLRAGLSQLFSFFV